MLDQLDTADSDYDVACRWLQSNEDIWTDWLPERGKCFSQFGIYDAPCPPNLWRLAFFSAWHWCMCVKFVYASMHPYPHALMHVHMQMGKYTIHINTHVHTTYIYIYIYMLAWVTCCCTRQHWPRGSQQSSCRLARAVRLAELVPQARATQSLPNQK